MIDEAISKANSSVEDLCANPTLDMGRRAQSIKLRLSTKDSMFSGIKDVKM